MRKYSRLKEAYYETDFIGDDDSKVGFDRDIPSDFPDWAPEGAYQAFINCYYNGDESQWNADVFSDVYEGDWGSLEDFIEHYFEDINTDEDWWDEDDEDSFDTDEFYDCVDFRSLGEYVKKEYEEDIKEYIVDGDLPSDEERAFYVKYLSDRANVLNFQSSYLAKVYIMAVSEKEDISYRGAVRWIDKNIKKIIHWDWGIDIINNNYCYDNGYYFLN